MIPLVTQTTGLKTMKAVFLLTADEPMTSQAYVMKMPRGIFTRKNGNYP